jgi:hypothetical protein
MPMNDAVQYPDTATTSPGPWPLGGGWSAGDFQNGQGLLGVAGSRQS